MGVVTKVLRILEALHVSPAGLQLRDVATQTGINKSTAYRFLAHLEQEGYVYRDRAAAYAIGVKLVRLGTGATYQATLQKICHPVVERLSAQTSETVNLAIIDGHEVLYLDVMESPHTFRLVSQVGLRRPLFCTALGKCLLAFLPPPQQERLFPYIKFEKFTPHTIGKLPQLKRDLAAIRQRGYALDNEEVYLGSRCVGAPIFDDSGSVVAAISVSGPTTRVTRDKIAAIAATAIKAANAISRRLGHTAPVSEIAAGASREQATAQAAG